MPLTLMAVLLTQVADAAASEYPISEIERPLTLPARIFSARISTDVEVLPGSRTVGASARLSTILSFGLGRVELGVGAEAAMTPSISFGGANLRIGVAVVRELLALWLRFELPVPWLPTTFYSWGGGIAASIRYRVRPWLALRVFEDVAVFRRFDAYGVSPMGFPRTIVQVNLPVGIEVQLAPPLVAAVRVAAALFAFEASPAGATHGFFPHLSAGFQLGYTPLQSLDVICSMTVQRYLVGPVPLTYLVNAGFVLRL